MTMHLEKYTTDWRGLIIFFTAISSLYAILLYLQRSPSLDTLKIGLALAAWFAFVGFGILLMTVYSYATISGTTLKFVYLLIQRRTIDISSITEITDYATYKVAKKSFRSVYIFYETREKETKYIEFRVSIFPEKTIGNLLRDLKKINPEIKLNAYCEKLAQSAR